MITTDTDLKARASRFMVIAKTALEVGNIVEALNHLRVATAAVQELERREIGVRVKEDK